MPSIHRVVVYHSPRCTKSRRTLELLRTHGIEPQVVEYLKTPPTATQLRALLQQLGMKPRQLLRVHEPEYHAAGLDSSDTTDERIITAMIEHPILIERPIVVANGRAVIGRPPENVLAIL